MLEQFDDTFHIRRSDNDRTLRRRARGTAADRGDGSSPLACPDDTSPKLIAVRRERRGMIWIVGAFVFCPCHLPLTFALVSAIFAGTGIEAVRHGNLILGAVVTTVWALGTWRGLWLLRSADRSRAACSRC